MYIMITSETNTPYRLYLYTDTEIYFTMTNTAAYKILQTIGYKLVVRSYCKMINFKCN